MEAHLLGQHRHAGIIQAAHDGIHPAGCNGPTEGFTSECPSTNGPCLSGGSPSDSLGSRRAVVIIPKDVLRKGATYQATLAVGGETYTWSFSLACQ